MLGEVKPYGNRIAYVKPYRVWKRKQHVKKDTPECAGPRFVRPQQQGHGSGTRRHGKITYCATQTSARTQTDTPSSSPLLKAAQSGRPHLRQAPLLVRCLGAAATISTASAAGELRGGLASAQNRGQLRAYRDDAAALIDYRARQGLEKGVGPLWGEQCGHAARHVAKASRALGAAAGAPCPAEVGSRSLGVGFAVCAAAAVVQLERKPAGVAGFELGRHTPRHHLVHEGGGRAGGDGG